MTDGDGPSESGTDTGERPLPPIREADERTTLVGMLDWYRDGVVSKVRGVSQEVAARAPMRSSTSIAGLVKHLALVEDSWFTVRLAGHEEPAVWAEADFDVDPDWEFHSAVDEPIDDLLALYAEACARSRAITDAHDLDHLTTGDDPLVRPFTLRYLLVHMIEETARHLGHLDVLRELLDGTTGE
jgi:uncharacterized damage-inducible protein DinB